MDMRQEAIDQFRLLVIGGRSKNVPRDKILCAFEHIEGDKARDMKGELSFRLGQEPNVILCFNDYVRHGTFYKFKAAAKTLGIPFVAASGGFWQLINEAKVRHGIDLTHVLANGRKKEEPVEDKITPVTTTTPVTPATPIVPMDEFDSKVFTKKDWIHHMPANAFRMNVVGGQEIPVLQTKAGVALVIKGKVLEYILAVVKKAKMGKGPRGALKRFEARELIDKVEAVYELKKFNIRMPEVFTVIKAVGYVLGTLPEPGMRKRAAKPRPQFMQPTLTPLVPPLSQLIQTAPEPKAPEPPAMPKPPVPDAAPRSAVDKVSELYERIIGLSKENSAFVEQITTLEAMVKTKDLRIKELEEKLRLLAR